jgi:predicted permease
MVWLRSVVSGLRGLLRRERVERDLDEEVRGFLEMAAEDKVKEGMSRGEAARLVRLEQGTREITKEAVRAASWETFLGACWQDSHFALRMLRKTPGFTAVAVLTLALGIGANTAIFSVVNAVLIRPLPFAHPEQIMYVAETFPGGTGTVSAPNYLDWREASQSFSALAIFSTEGVNLTGSDQPLHLYTARVSRGFFETFEVVPQLGHLLTDADFTPGGDSVVLVSERFWQSHTGGDPQLVGKKLELNGNTATVIGVLPDGFAFPSEADLWQPHSLDDSFSRNRGTHFFRAVGRLRSGVTLESARAEMDAIAQRLARAYPDTNQTRGVRITPLEKLVVENVEPSLIVLQAGVFFVLLIGCANVANLLLARSSTRGREIAVRSALGATRARLTAQLLTEGILLSLFGGAIGIAMAQLGLRGLLATLPAGSVPRMDEISIDSRVLFFSLGLSVMTGILFGLAPSLRAAGLELSESLNRGSARGTAAQATSRLRAGLVVLEVAVTAVLLVSGGLMIRSLWSLLQVDPGFNSSGMVAARLYLPQMTPAEVPAELSRLALIQERVAHLAGVHGAALSVYLPMDGSNINGDVGIEGRPLPEKGNGPVAEMRIVGPNFFEVLGTPILRGREFEDRDSAGSEPVAVINEAMSEHFWPHSDALGQHVAFQDEDHKWNWMRIVGVAANVRTFGLNREVRDEVYVPLQQLSVREVSFLGALTPVELIVRAERNGSSLARAIRSEVQAVDRNQPVSKLQSMTQVIDWSISNSRLLAMVMSAFAALALFLAAAGIYSVMAYVMALRTQEIGIRVALGASRIDVLRLALSQAMSLVVSGLLAGLVVAFGVSRLFGSMLFSVKPSDPFTFGTVAVLLCGVGLFACYVPAARAMRVDPVVALRYE